MISPNELVALVVGSILAFVGAAALAVGAARARGRDVAAVSFGIFVTLYAIRLLVAAGSIRTLLALSDPVGSALGAWITYVILGPAVLSLSALVDSRNRVFRLLWRADFVYAAAAIIVDLLRGRPGSLMWLNPVAVTINNLVIVLFLGGRVRRVKWTPGVVATLAGFTLFLVFASYETYFGASASRAHISLEPVGMLAFIAGLGYLLAERVVATERRLIAVSHELETARRIQRSILPGSTPRVAGLAVGAHLVPVTEVAGDFYDFIVGPDATLGVLVADVSGHGVPAALIASMVKVALASESDYLPDPGTLMTRVNRTLCGKFDLAFVTAVYAYFDARGRTLSYAAAGHPPPLLRRATGEVERLEQRDLVLGFTPAACYSAGRVRVGAGDCVVFYTDGVTDVEGPGGEFFGDRRFLQTIREASDSRPDAMIASILSSLRAWKSPGSDEFADDLTMVAVRIE